MIFTWFLNLIYSLISSVLNLFPEASLSPELTNAAQGAGTYLANISPIFPVSTLLTIISLLIALELGIISYKIIKWAYNKIPGIT